MCILQNGNKRRHYYSLANEVAKGYSNATVRPSFLPSVRPSIRPSVTSLYPCEHSKINILQWILTTLGTYLVLERIWNPIDFQGHRSRSPGQIFRRGDTPRFALPLLLRTVSEFLYLFPMVCFVL